MVDDQKRILQRPMLQIAGGKKLSDERVVPFDVRVYLPCYVSLRSLVIVV